MSLPVGELFMLGFRGPTVPEWLHAFAAEFGLGGVLLFDYDCIDKKYERNIFSPAQVKQLCEQIHNLPSRPQVYIDQEGGKVRRLKERYGFAPLPSAKQIAKISQNERLNLLQVAFAEMRDIGIDVNLAPVIDLDLNPDSPDLGAVERSFSADVTVVKKCALDLAAVASEYHIGLCLKHFPGCGGAKVNSHNELMDLSATVTDQQLDLFQNLLTQIPMILLSHGIVRQWEDNTPVCLSRTAIARVRAWNPNALIVTDDLQMEGLQQVMSTEAACVRAMESGADLLCIGNNLRDEQSRSVAFAQGILERCEADRQVRKNVETAIVRMKRFKNS